MKKIVLLLIVVVCLSGCYVAQPHHGGRHNRPYYYRPIYLPYLGHWF